MHGLKGEIHKKMGAPIPINGTQFEDGRLFLAGDAAGLANPLTFGGMAPIIYGADFLYQAILSGSPGIYSTLIKQNGFYPPEWTARRDLFYSPTDMMNRIGRICENSKIYPPSRTLISRLARQPGMWIYILRLLYNLRRLKRVSW